VVVKLSSAAQKILGQSTDAGDAGGAGGAGDAGGGGGAASTGGAGDSAGAGDRGAAPPATPGGKSLSPAQQQVVEKLAARDTAVRAHEAAHQAAAGGLGGAATFSYQQGPDGRRYAVGGEVPITLESGRTPEETISNAETVRAAALAPVDPSAQDLSVAAQASQVENAARQQITDDKASGKVGGTGAGKGAGKADAKAGTKIGDPANPVAPLRILGAAQPAGTTQAAGGAAAVTTKADTTIATDGAHASLAVFSALKAERAPGQQIPSRGGSAAGHALFRRAIARYAAA
jgi:hypothetical protein